MRRGERSDGGTLCCDRAAYAQAAAAGGQQEQVAAVSVLWDSCHCSVGSAGASCSISNSKGAIGPGMRDQHRSAEVITVWSSGIHDMSGQLQER